MSWKYVNNGDRELERKTITQTYNHLIPRQKHNCFSRIKLYNHDD